VVDLTKSMQVKLLRVLQEGTFERVGGEKTVSVDVRVISAANRDLKREVERKNFREDLYYRLNVVPVELPPLRTRKNDIPLLAEEFLRQASEQGQKTAGLSKKALSMMMDYLWPGNVRELQNALHYALVKCKGRLIRPEDLPMELKSRRSSRRGPTRKLNPEMVKAALDLTGGNKAKAARHLGVGRATLYRFLEEFPDVS
ncbi:MAG: sigma 54-interacting transcriptional regulator, partial [Syntrophobacteria bacterium]